MTQPEGKPTQFATAARVKALGLRGDWGGAPRGVLALDGNRLVFVVPPDKIKLDTTLEECEFDFKKWMMGQGFVIKTPDKKYSVEFTKIAPFVVGNALQAAGLDALGFGISLSGMVSVVQAPKVCKEWKEVLTAAGAL